MTKKRATKGKFQYWLTKEGLIKIEGWAKDGLTDEEIAAKIGIARSTLGEWKNKYPTISDTLKQGKEVVDRQVENSLLKRALGYSYVEVTKEPITNPNTGEVKFGISKEVTKHVAPDTTAQIFWLKNRKPEEWREKKELNVTVNKSLEDFFGDD